MLTLTLLAGIENPTPVNTVQNLILLYRDMFIDIAGGGGEDEVYIFLVISLL